MFEDLDRFKSKTIPDSFSIWGQVVLHRVSLPLSWLFIRLKVSPNGVTLLSLIVGLGGCVCFLQLHSIIPNRELMFFGLVALNLWGVLDCCDGVVARATNQASSVGAFFEALTGEVVVAFLFLSVGIGSMYAVLGAWCSLFYGFTRAVFTHKEAAETRFFKGGTGMLLKLAYNLTNADGVVFLLIPFTVLNRLDLFLMVHGLLSPASFCFAFMNHVHLLKERVV